MILWSFFIAAEKIRRGLGFGKIIHLIADQHALSNSFTDIDAIKRATKNLSDKVSHAALKLGLSGVYEVKIGSELAKEPGYAEELKAIRSSYHEYVKRELADISFLRKMHCVALKLSWQQESKRIDLDERHFDTLFREHFGPCMSFVYLKAGRSFDSHRLNVCPYTSKPGEPRILIDSLQRPSEMIARVNLKSKSIRQTLKHLELILDEFDEVFGPPSVSSKDLGLRIEGVIARVFY